jgi:hypothetical protein
MPRKTPSRLSKLKERLQRAFGKNLPEDAFSKLTFAQKTVEERREEAVTYIVEKYFELKKREEAYIKKLESYGTVRRWLFERSRSIKAADMIFKEIIVKPVIITMMMFSIFLSIILATMVGQEITLLTRMYLPNPFNYVLDVVILFPIGFSPGIMSIVLNYYREKKKLLRLLRDYSLEI